MKQRPGMFRSRGDAILCFAFAAAISGWLVVGAAIIVDSLQHGGRADDAIRQQ